MKKKRSKTPSPNSVRNKRKKNWEERTDGSLSLRRSHERLMIGQLEQSIVQIAA
jgi:hypothetical protein